MSFELFTGRALSLYWCGSMLVVLAGVSLYGALCNLWGAEPSDLVGAAGIASAAGLILGALTYLFSQRCGNCGRKGTLMTVAEKVEREDFGQEMRWRSMLSFDPSRKATTTTFISVPVTVRRTLVRETRACRHCGQHHRRLVRREADEW